MTDSPGNQVPGDIQASGFYPDPFTGPDLLLLELEVIERPCSLFGPSLTE
jgi:hypothetical protein